MNTILYAKNIGRVSYKVAMSLQESIVRLKIHDDTVPDVCLFLEHPATYTVGRRIKNNTTEKERLMKLGAEYHESARGGLTTFHGPGQLVVYPIINVKNFNLNVRLYVRALENSIIKTCSSFGIVANVANDVGVWIEDRKIAALGVNVNRWITSHGFALNCNNDLAWFNHIVPCGLEGKKVTSISQELSPAHDVTIEKVIPLCMNAIASELNAFIRPLDDYANAPANINLIRSLLNEHCPEVAPL